MEAQNLIWWAEKKSKQILIKLNETLKKQKPN